MKDVISFVKEQFEVNNLVSFQRKLDYLKT